MSLFVFPNPATTVDTTGLATEAKQDTQITLLTDIDTNTDGIEAALTTLNAKDFATQTTLATRASEATLATRASEATLATRASETTVAAIEVDTTSIDTKLTTTNSLLTTIDADTSALAGTVLGSELQVDIITSALPTGAATSALQTTGNTSLSTIAGAVSGTEVQVDVLTSALPTGAATSANQTTEIGHLSTLAGTVSGTEIQVDVLTMPSVTVTATNLDIRDLTHVSDSVKVGDGTDFLAVNLDGSINITDNGGSITVDGTFFQATQPVSAVSLPLPTGAATEATLATRASETTVAAIEVDTSSIDTKLTTTNSLLTTIDADTSALAGTVAGTELQVDVITMPTVTVTATNLDIRDLSSATDSIAVTDGGGSITVDGTFFQATQPVSAVSLPLPTGAATSANQTTEIGHLATIAGAVSGTEMQVDVITMPTVTVTATNLDIRDLSSSTDSIAVTDGGGSLTVDGTVTVTATNLDIRDLTSGSDSVAAVQSGTWNITNISGTISLPTGAATEATLASLETNSDTILTNTNRLGPVDQFDTPLLDVSSTNITASSGSPVQVVASTAAAVKKIVTVEDIGEFIGLYTGAAASEVLHVVLPLGGGEIEVNIAASTRISLRHMKNTAITTGFMSINFLG